MTFTDKEKVKLYERFLHDLQMYAHVLMDQEKVAQLIKNACAWSYAHRCGNGMYTDEEQQELIDLATNNLSNINNKK